MNALAPLLRPAFEWNHDWVMRNGGDRDRRSCSAAGCWPRTELAI